MVKGIIYKYTFPNGKVYIGQTINPRSRKQQHLSEKTGASNTAFWRAFKKYGVFEYSEIEVVTANTKVELIDKLNLLEQQHIADYDSMNPAHGYNLTSGGKVCVISEEAKQRMSDARTDKVAILQYDLNGDFVAEHASCVDAAKAIKSHAASIHACCTGRHGKNKKKSQQVKGFTFRFKADYPDIPNHIDLKITTNSRPVLQFTTDGMFVREWESVSAIQKELGIIESNVRQCIRGKTRQCAGYMWRYKDNFDTIPETIEPIRKARYSIRFTPEQIAKGKENYRKKYAKPVIQFSFEGKFIAEYESLDDAGKACGGDGATICNACKHKTVKSAFGFQWRYKNDVENPQKGIEPYSISYGPQKTVLQFTKNGEFIKEWSCASEAAEFYGVNRNSLYIALRDMTRPLKGYLWAYKGMESGIKIEPELPFTRF